MANDMVVDHVLVSGTGLIMHGPPSIDNLKLAICDEPFYLILSLVILVIPPHLEELHFNLREFTLRVIEKGIDDSSKFHSYISPLGVLLGSVEVLVDGLEPTDIIMGVRHDMHS